MISAAEAIRATVENAGADCRRVVQAAVAMAVEHGLESELLHLLQDRSNERARWLRAALIEAVHGQHAALPYWEAVVAEDGREIPEALLHRARALARTGDEHKAATLLRLALHGAPEYDFFLRAEALVRKCKQAFGCQRRVKIALLSSSTTTLLRGAIELLCLRDRLEPQFYEPPFGTYMQDLLQARSGLKQFAPEFIVLLLNWRDLAPDAAENGHAREAISRVTDAWRAAIESTPAQIIQFTFATPTYDAFHGLSSRMQTGRVRTLRRINDALYEQAPDRVILIDSERIAAACRGGWEDPVSWSSAKLYPSQQALPVAAEHIISCVRAELGLSKKVLVLDLDNTLWGGVIGEDGLQGIRLGPPSAIGERYQELHHYLKALKQRGILLSVVSKNNPAEADAVFRHHQASVLHRDDFVSFKANWVDKATNIRQLAAELRLGVDTFVFLDDAPAERSAVRREFPDIVVPEISGEPSETIAALERGLYFQATRLTAEDLARSASYIAGSQQEELRVSSASLESYLVSLAMEIEHGPVDPATSLRVTQLINKTNQFNLTTKRYGQQEVQLRMAAPGFWFRWYRLRDRFADHGLIGILLAEAAQQEWKIDLWLMSCRVIGRDVEAFMFRDLVGAAQRAGATRLSARYVPTAKNELVKELLPNFGFVPSGKDGEYILDLATATVPDCRFHNSVASQPCYSDTLT